jgi:hypothetical protein
MEGGGQRDVEEMWRDRLHAAARQYHLASANLRRVREHIKEPDSSAVAQASRMESQARAEYLNALRVFTKLVLHGEPPEEGQRSA